MAKFSVWHGDPEQLVQLIAATQTHEAPKAMTDQRFLDGVLFGRWLRERLLAEEECFPPDEPTLA